MAVKLPYTIVLGDEPDMRSKSFGHLLQVIEALPADRRVEITLKNPKISKTRSQLGGLFGVWYDYLIEEVPRYNQHGPSEARGMLHYDMKSLFLGRIYGKEPEGYIQEMWVEKAADLGDRLSKARNEGEHNQVVALLSRHTQELSLSWASVQQMREYMGNVYWHWQSLGYPPPILDRFKKYYDVEAH